MTFEEMIAAIPYLTYDERLALLKVQHRSFRPEAAIYDVGSLLQLRGVLKPDTPVLDTYDYNEAYADSAIEKYR